MTALTNSFEGGTNGTTVTTGNSGGASGNAFDVVDIGTGATVAFDNTQAAHGGLALKLATGVTSAHSNVEWSTSLTGGGNPAQVWFRLYLYLTANPAASIRIFTGSLSGTVTSRCQINTSGKINMLNAAGSALTTSTNAVPLNQWFRVEGFILYSATVGQTEVKLFSSMDSTTATETNTSTAVQNTGTAADTVYFGPNNNVANMGPIWLDDIGVSTTGYLGPVTPAGRQAAAPGQLGAFPDLPPGAVSPAAWQQPPYARLLTVTTVAGSGGAVLPKPSLAGTGSIAVGAVLPTSPPMPPGLSSPAAWQFPRYPRLAQTVTIAGSGGVTLPKPSLAGSGTEFTTAAPRPLMPPGLASPAAWQFPSRRVAATVTIAGSGGVTLPKPSLAGTGALGAPRVAAAPLMPPGLASPAAWQFPPRRAGAVTTIAGSGGAVLPKPSLAGAGTVTVPVALRPLLPPGAQSPAAWQFPKYPRLLATATISGSGSVALPKPSLAASGTAVAATGPLRPTLIPPGFRSPMAFQRMARPAGGPPRVAARPGLVTITDAPAATTTTSDTLAARVAIINVINGTVVIGNAS